MTDQKFDWVKIVNDYKATHPNCGAFLILDMETGIVVCDDDHENEGTRKAYAQKPTGQYSYIPRDVDVQDLLDNPQREVIPHLTDEPTGGNGPTGPSIFNLDCA